MGGAGVLALLFLSSVVRFTVISFDMSGELYWTFENEFQLKWIHSVEKEEWIEDYEVKEGNLLLSKTYFKTFGAGVPSTATHVEHKNGYVVMEIGILYPLLHLAVSENVKSTVTLNSRTIPLYEFVEDYESVTIAVKHYSIWELLTKGEHL